MAKEDKKKVAENIVLPKSCREIRWEERQKARKAEKKNA